jgi:hypothetical protein
MSDIATEIFKKYGLAAILFAVVLALLAWGLAHFAASPGTEVSVLWGLAKYTKPSVHKEAYLPNAAPRATSLADNTTIARSDSSHDLPPIDIETLPAMSRKEYEKTLASLRVKRGLRELTTLESGKKIAELPINSYFFTSSVYLRSVPNETFESRVISAIAARFRTVKSNYFELHSTKTNGLCLIGIVTESDAARISQLSGKVAKDIVLSPCPWATMTTLVTLPIVRIESCAAREIEPSQDDSYRVLDIRLK